MTLVNIKVACRSVKGLSLLLAWIIAVSAQAQNLRSNKTEFEWNNWNIKINSLMVASSVMHYREVTAAADDSLFVVLQLTVQNNDHYGKTFIPQNMLKIVIGDNSFDAADIDDNYEYIKNIEPTLIRRRACYFEVPKALFKKLFTIRFSEFLNKPEDISVAIFEPEAVPLPNSPVIDKASMQAVNPSSALNAPTPTIEEANPPPTPVPRLRSKTSGVVDQDELLILDVERALNGHDWQTLASYTADGEVDYFGRRNTTNEYIRRDMEEDARTYSSSRRVRYLGSFNRRVDGATIYDSIDVYSETQERHGRLHKALTRLTVGYVLTNGIPTIYSLQLKVLGNRPL